MRLRGAADSSERMRVLAFISVIIAVAALLAPMAHVMEMPNKLQMDGPLWLAVQQQLYRGWGPFIGAPTEIGAVIVNVALFVARSDAFRARRMWGIAAGLYLLMIAVFFVFNAPVNAAFNGWTSATLPADWPAFRWRWEIGHALAAILAIAALLLVVRAKGLASRR